MPKTPYKSHFPEKTDPKVVTALQKIVKQCSKELANVQTQFHFDTLRLSAPDRTRLAEMLVDFALDLHSGSEIWAALEKYNTDLFGTPLPLIQPMNAKLPPGICRERVQFLLWNLYPQFDPDSWYSPKHVDLLIAAEAMADWVKKQIPSLPKISPIKTFLAGPNDYGWQVKRKLIWLGMNSYLFRILFEHYFEENYEGEYEIGVIDDFICQNTTPWSGLGPIDILAECLDVPKEQKIELRSWYLRHFSIYEIVKTDNEISEAVNLVNNAPYRIREGAPGDPKPMHFKPGMTIYGSLVPWHGEWYWSGGQHDLTPYSSKQIAETVAKLKQNTRIVARYWPEREKMVFERMEEDYQSKLKHYGKDFAVLPDGRTWEREETKRLAADMKARGFMGKMPRMSIPDHLRNCNEGIGIYLDPVEGMEIMDYFNAIRSGLKKNGNTCKPDEENMIRNWIESPNISPAFIYRALKEYGGEESIKYAVRWETDASYWLDYLLRCQKGEYYRRRFPPLGIVDSEND